MHVMGLEWHRAIMAFTCALPVIDNLLWAIVTDSDDSVTHHRCITAGSLNGDCLCQTLMKVGTLLLIDNSK